MYKTRIYKQLREQEVDFDHREFKKLQYDRRFRRQNPVTIQILRALEANDAIHHYTVDKNHGVDSIFCNEIDGIRLWDGAINLRHWKKIAEQYYDPYVGCDEECKRLIEVSALFKHVPKPGWRELFTDDADKAIAFLNDAYGIAVKGGSEK
jgi:hypothetical protein